MDLDCLTRGGAGRKLAAGSRRSGQLAAGGAGILRRLKLSEIASRLECRLEGDGTVEIRRIAAIEDAGSGDLTFFVNPKYADRVRETRASAVILGERAETVPPSGVALLRTANPYLAFARAAEIFAPPPAIAPGIHRLASVASTASVAPDAAVAAFVSIGEGARVGARTILFPHVTVGDGATIGDDCILHARVSVRERVTLGNRIVVQDGAVIGSDGFGFARTPQGTHHKIPAGRRTWSLKTTSRSARTRRSIGRRSGRPASARAARSTTSCRSPTASRSARASCSRRRSASPAARSSRTTSRWPDRWASPVT